VFPDASAFRLQELARDRRRDPTVVILSLWLHGLNNLQNPEGKALNPVDGSSLEAALDLTWTCMCQLRPFYDIDIDDLPLYGRTVFPPRLSEGK
jgi:hypothetical protein